MQHQVIAKFAPKTLNKNDMVLIVKTNGRKLGELMISRGNIEWIPSGGRLYKQTMQWRKFAEIMQREGTKRKI
jgi:hypothetical protein